MIRAMKQRLFLLAAALALVAVAAYARWREPIAARLAERRLAAEASAPEAAVDAARRLAGLDPEERWLAAARPRARVRYRLATGFDLRDVLPRLLAAAADAEGAKAALERANERVSEVALALAADVKTDEGRAAAIAFLREAREPALRKRAATALGMSEGEEALAALIAAFRDADAEVATQAYVQARTIAGAGGRGRVTAAALEERALRARAISTAAAARERESARPLADALARSGLSDTDHLRLVSALEAITGVKAGNDAAAWRDWLDAHP
jgi:hypothetical protein